MKNSVNDMKAMKAKQRIILLFVFVSIVIFITYKCLQPSESGHGLNRNSKNIININELHYFGTCLLKEAGKVIVKIRAEHKEDSFAQKKKDKSVVTIADLQSHEIIVHTLNHKYPKLRVISEESSKTDTHTEAEKAKVRLYLSKCDNYVPKIEDLHVSVGRLNVWVDPLDATQEYSENLVQYVTVMFCIVVDGQPKAGVIHKPFSDTTVSSLYTDLKTHLDFKNDSTDKTRIVISRSHAGKVESVIKEKISGYTIIPAGGSGYKTTSLLKNEADLYLHTTNIYKWDVCAPNAILRNMGGKMTSLNGENIDFSYDSKSTSVNGIVASLYNHDFYLNIFKPKNK